MSDINLTPEAQNCLQKLMMIWFDFERNLNRVPIINRLETGHFSIEDYRQLLLNMRQQVIEGSRWIARTASSFDRDFSDVRSIVIGHATDEHRDYEMLEKDYVTAGGDLHDIQSADKNIGTEALHAFLFHRASQPNPVDMLGAMWIIEGLGQKMAEGWARRIEQLIGIENAVNFMRYHSDNDDAHMEKLYLLLNRICSDEKQSLNIQKTAKVVARLYQLQLEEIDV